MKVEFYEETTVQKKERYVADDGTVFDNEADCVAYENQRQRDDMPYPETVSIPAPLENYDVCISLLKSPLDFKRLLTEYQDILDTWTWDLFGMEAPTAYPCTYVYWVDKENRMASRLCQTPRELILDFERVVRRLSCWCAEQLDAMCDKTEI